MIKPIDIPTSETVTFVATYSPVGADILEIGCGEGHVAAALINRGYGVMGVDENAEAVIAAQSRGVAVLPAKWPDCACDPVDTVVFTRSLHHIVPVVDAIRKARALLKNTGHVLVEDFSYQDTDAATVDWLLDKLRAPPLRELIRPIRGELLTNLVGAKDALAAWRADHDHDLHTASTMTKAIDQEFGSSESFTVPYLYRYFVPVLPETQQATRVLACIYDEEARLGANGDIVLIGRRIVARH